MDNEYMDEPRSEIDWRAAQKLQLGISGFIVFLMVVIWVATGVGYFWPIWVWFGLTVPVAFQYAIQRAVQGPRQWRALSVHAAVSCVIGALLTFIWVLTGFGFWLFWPLFGMSAALVAHLLVTSWWRAMHPPRERELSERVDVLTRTRRGALDVQAAELRRIERDLHDGAQSRLVALSMQLGRAEDRLEAHPEAAELVRKARMEAGNAIAELRDLARGIAPPVLADRGLVAAVDALGKRSALPFSLDARLSRRLSPVVESAAYFVVAEALTNVAKHAPGAAARVTMMEEAGRLIVEVDDDGPGGANARGSGLSGLRNRVEALDGLLVVRSGPGEGTTVHAELPCE
ncbi:MAG TPA: sensor histidine kinase [Solirubrobacter sp.]|nr:sensor histidine kinase [Solirubrobacter sp.]